MREARWKLFGHILRRDQNIPANLSIKFYFENNKDGFRGKPRTTLPVVLQQDLERYYTNTEPQQRRPRKPGKIAVYRRQR